MSGDTDDRVSLVREESDSFLLKPFGAENARSQGAGDTMLGSY